MLVQSLFRETPELEVAMLLGVYVWARSRVDEALDQRGATAAEYALLITLIAVAIAAAVTVFENKISDFFTSFNF